MLHRYHRRFGGIGTIVTLDDGRAFTAAHCLAAVDGARGVIVGAGERRWRVVRRWAPSRLDLALLRLVDRAVRAGTTSPGLETRATAPGGQTGPAGRSVVRAGVRLEFVGHTGGRFQTRGATIIAVTPTSATAVVEHGRGVCANDSGGPVFLRGVLVGIVTHRTGPPQSALCSRHVVFTRLDSPEMRLRIARAYGRVAQQIAPRPNTDTAADV